MCLLAAQTRPPSVSPPLASYHPLHLSLRVRLGQSPPHASVSVAPLMQTDSGAVTFYAIPEVGVHGGGGGGHVAVAAAAGAECEADVQHGTYCPRWSRHSSGALEGGLNAADSDSLVGCPGHPLLGMLHQTRHHSAPRTPVTHSTPPRGPHPTPRGNAWNPLDCHGSSGLPLGSDAMPVAPLGDRRAACPTHRRPTVEEGEGAYPRLR